VKFLRYFLILLLPAVNVQAHAPSQYSKQVVVPYVVSYLGIPIIDMVQTIVTKDSLVTISYDNQMRGFFNHLVDLHNVYGVTFVEKSYQPIRWSKQIQEGDLDFSLSARRIPGKNEVRYSDGTKRKMPKGAFTVFSATHYLEHMAGDPEKFPLSLKIYIDGEIWRAQVNRWSDPTHSQLDDHPPGTVLLRAVLHHDGGKSVVSKNDILTGHIASEGSLFLLWVDSNGQIIRARFGTFPSAVELDLLKN